MGRHQRPRRSPRQPRRRHGNVQTHLRQPDGNNIQFSGWCAECCHLAAAAATTSRIGESYRALLRSIESVARMRMYWTFWRATIIISRVTTPRGLFLTRQRRSCNLHGFTCGYKRRAGDLIQTIDICVFFDPPDLIVTIGTDCFRVVLEDQPPVTLDLDQWIRRQDVVGEKRRSAFVGHAATIAPQHIHQFMDTGSVSLQCHSTDGVKSSGHSIVP